jgi:signal transduction histidine kinase
MKNKIALRLALYFSAALISLAVIIGFVFVTLFRNTTMKEQKQELETRAAAIADTLSEYMGSNSTGGGYGMMGGGRGGYGMYLRFIDDIAMTDVWIVDEHMNLITTHMTDYAYADLPPDADLVILDVLNGKTTFSEGFSDLLNKPTLTVGTPIIIDGLAAGAVLLHSPVEGLEEAALQGTRILAVSIGTALFAALILSLFFAYTFTKPLKKMKSSALLLAEGNYSVKTGVRQKDEIGELAGAIDVLSERLEAAKGESVKLEKLRRDFVANISHELKTPVTVLRGSLEALCDEIVTDPAQVKAYHSQMLTESRFLERLVSDLLDLSKLQNHDFHIQQEELSLTELLLDCTRSARQIAQAKSVDIRPSFQSGDILVTGDYGRLRQMLLIVLDNAVKFSPKNSVVDITLQKRTVCVHDCGIGISAEDLPHIFDRFYKTASEENKSGTGLGLAIAKQIADRHGIRLSVQSRSNEGSTFCFEF